MDQDADACLRGESWNKKAEDRLLAPQLGTRTSDASNGSLCACPGLTGDVPRVLFLGGYE